MRLHPAATSSIALFGATALLLAGCAGGPDGIPPGDADISAQDDREITSIPVGQPFGEAQWSVNVDATSEQSPLVIGNHVVALSEDTVTAWSADGTEAWQVPTSRAGESSDVALRQADSNTVAVIATGMSEGEGLAKSGYAAHVTLIDITSGKTTEVDIAGSDADAPSLSAVGVAFTLPDGTGVVITPEGETVDVPDVATTTDLRTAPRSITRSSRWATPPFGLLPEEVRGRPATPRTPGPLATSTCRTTPGPLRLKPWTPRSVSWSWVLTPASTYLPSWTPRPATSCRISNAGPRRSLQLSPAPIVSTASSDLCDCPRTTRSALAAAKDNRP